MSGKSGDTPAKKSQSSAAKKATPPAKKTAGKRDGSFANEGQPKPRRPKPTTDTGWTKKKK